MKYMTTVVTRFSLPANVAAADIRVAFVEAASHFRDVPGLVRKQFLLSADGRTGGGVYLWNNEAAARSFMQERVAPMVRSRFKTEPTIEFFETPMIVEN